ncbi:MAG: hypothetical protein EA400_06675 [Chromatiaceae bacterium]|nr:MAG: hypothetical protein EA400_06675 [Chromatiaceae bacterium]
MDPFVPAMTPSRQRQPDRTRRRHLAGGALFVLLGAEAAASGAPAGPPAATRFALTPIHQFDANLDRGGRAGFSGLLGSVSHTWPLAGRSSIGLGLRLNYQDWQFDHPRGLGGSAPWDQVYRVALALPYSLGLGDDWRLSLTPTLEYAGESGARFGDALEYGGTAAIARTLGPDLALGLGVGLFQGLERTRAFPFLFVDWRLSDRLRLTNSTSAGPAGPAGLELGYTLPAGWNAGLGGAWRSFRQRLDRNGPHLGGIGEYRSVPVYLRIGRRLGPRLSLDLYAGAAVGARLRVEDAGGRRLYQDNQATAALLGLSFSGRF